MVGKLVCWLVVVVAVALIFQSINQAAPTHADDEEQDKSDDDGDYANEILRVGYRRDDFAMASYHVQTLIFVLRYDLRQRRTTEMSVSANPCETYSQLDAWVQTIWDQNRSVDSAQLSDNMKNLVCMYVKFSIHVCMYMYVSCCT